jgi:hypothetical protein
MQWEADKVDDRRTDEDVYGQHLEKGGVVGQACTSCVVGSKFGQSFQQGGGRWSAVLPRLPPEVSGTFRETRVQSRPRGAKRSLPPAPLQLEAVGCMVAATVRRGRV